MRTGRVKVIANAMAREIVTNETGKVVAGHVHRQDDGQRGAGPLPHSGARRERVRVRPTAAQLEIVAASTGPREFLGQGRTVSDGHRRLQCVRVTYPRCRECRTTTPTATAAISTCPGGCGTRRISDFPRGYHIEVGGGYGMPAIGSFTGIVNRTEGYGLAMKQAIRDEYGTTVGLSGRGEMIPNEQSFCEIDPDGEGSLGHSRPAVPLGVERLRAGSGAAHAVHVPRDSRRHGRPGQRRRQRLDLRASSAGTASPAGQIETPSHTPRPARRPSREAARSFTKSARSAWATIRGRAC